MANRLSAPLLHKLVTILDALNYNIPIPLWEASSRTPQPTKGYLPETGKLHALKVAADKRETAATILASIEAFGPDGPYGAHMIVLGDTIKALRIAGFEREARQLSFEALYPAWPKATR